MTQNDGITYYALKVNGSIVTQPVQNVLLAESARTTLAESDRTTAVVVPVNATGQELLLG